MVVLKCSVTIILCCLFMSSYAVIRGIFNNVMRRLPSRRYLFGALTLLNVNKTTTSEFLGSLLNHTNDAYANNNGVELPCECPLPKDIQSPFVRKHFNHSKMEGVWYELAMKDLTQPRYCSCQTSTKFIKANESGNTYFSSRLYRL